MCPPASLQLLFFLLAVAPAAVPGEERVVWRLGEPDRSDHEFITPADAPTNQDLVVKMGTGNEAKHWPRFHPGSGNGAFGGGPHRYVLIFNLPASEPVGMFYLNLSLLFRQPRVPALELELNGHRGRYYFDPSPMFELGSVDDEFNVIRSFQHRKIPLPANLFRPGTNVLVLSAIDEPSTVIRNRNVGGSGDSGFFYDALALLHDPEAEAQLGLEASLVPTVFYLRTAHGVREQCYLITRFPAAWPGGQVRVTIGKFSISFPTPKPAEFGEARYSFLAPADLLPRDARIELTALVPAPARRQSSPEASGTSAPALTASFQLSLNTTVPFTPCRKWKIFYAPNEHLDVGYTDYRAKVAEVHARAMDDLLKVLAAHPNYRFNLDGSWIMDQWCELRSFRHTAKVLPHVREGQIGMNAFYCSAATEYSSLEENLRNLYFSQELKDQFGVPLDYALVSDVPSASWSVPSILASAGIRYFANGGNQDRGPMVVHGHWNVRSPFWWEGPDGQRVLTWFSAHYHQFKALFGLPPALESGEGGVARFLRAYEDNHYTPDAVLLYGTEVENLPTEYDDAGFVDQWNSRFAWPKLLTCRFSEFFRYIERHYGDSLPVVRGTGGAYWADNFGILAAATARDRANQSRAICAEAVAALACAMDPKLRFSHDVDLDIWKDLLLYSEHNFGIGGLNDRPDCEEAMGIVREKEDQTVRAEWNIDKLMRHGLSQLGDRIKTEGQNLIVFNPLSWRRSDLVQIEIADGSTITNLTTGNPIELEMLAEKDGRQTVRFLAENVPPVGYKVYRVGKGHIPPATVSEPAPVNILENQFYRITLAPDRAALRSIYDKELRCELVDSASPYLAGEYLFVSGGGTEIGRGRGNEDSQLLHPFHWLPVPELTIHHPENGGLLEEGRTPYGRKARLTASAVHTPRIETEILLRDDRKEIDLRTTIQVDLLYAKQASYFVFPWNMSNAVFRYDIPNGFVNPAKDLLEGGCSDWFSIQHVVNAENSDLSVSLAAVDAPLVCLGDICRGRWLPQFTNCSSAVFSYALNNYWSPKWAGKKSAQLQFRYALTSGQHFDPAQASWFGREARYPLEIATLKTSDKLPGVHGDLSPSEGTFATVMPENIVLCALKPAEEGPDLVVRLLETAGRESEGMLKLPLVAVISAREANALEVAIGALKTSSHGVRFHIKPNQVMTLRIQLRPSATEDALPGVPRRTAPSHSVR